MPMRQKVISIDEETEKWLSSQPEGASATVRMMAHEKMAIHQADSNIEKVLEDILSDEEKLKSYREFAKSKEPELESLRQELKMKFGRFILLMPTRDSMKYAIHRLEELKLPKELVACPSTANETNAQHISKPPSVSPPQEKLFGLL